MKKITSIILILLMVVAVFSGCQQSGTSVAPTPEVTPEPTKAPADITETTDYVTEQWIAVYYGPSAVGTAAGAFLITDVPVSHLSKEQIRALKNGEYEYHSQDDLIAMLDNMSEL